MAEIHEERQRANSQQEHHKIEKQDTENYALDEDKSVVDDLVRIDSQGKLISDGTVGNDSSSERKRKKPRPLTFSVSGMKAWGNIQPGMLHFADGVVMLPFGEISEVPEGMFSDCSGARRNPGYILTLIYFFTWFDIMIS